MSSDTDSIDWASRERLTNMRIGAVGIIRRHWPTHLKGLEREMGSRLSDAPDPLIIAYLDAFASIAEGHTDPKAGADPLADIRRALTDAGYAVDDNASAVELAVAIRSVVAALKESNENLRKQCNSRNIDAVKDSAWAASSNRKSTSGAEKILSGQASKGRNKVVTQPLPGVLDIDSVNPLDEPSSSAEDAAVEPVPQLAPAAAAKVHNLLQEAKSPVFISDIVGILDSPEDAATWVDDQKGVGNWAFIHPQGKHRQRGALVIPTKQARGNLPAYRQSIWGRILDKGYSGGSLYVLGTVLRKLDKSIIAASYQEDAVAFSVSGGQTNTAVVVALTDKNNWYGTLTEIGSFNSSGQFSQVITICCPRGKEQALTQALSNAGKTYGWSTHTPVTVVSLTDWYVRNSSGTKVAF